MTPSQTQVLDHLTNKGAATKFELQEALGYTKDHVQHVVTSLVTKGSVQATKARKRHNSNRSHVVYSVVVADAAPQPAPEPLNIFEHASLYNRLRELEVEFKNVRADMDDALAGIRNDAEERSKDAASLQGIRTALKVAIQRIKDLELDRIRIDGVLVEQCDRLTALEPKPAVDPVYVEIERELTDKLGGQFSPELLRVTIDNAYAERVK